MDDLAQLKTLALFNQARKDLHKMVEVKGVPDLGEVAAANLAKMVEEKGRLTSLSTAKKAVKHLGPSKIDICVKLASEGAFNEFLKEELANESRFQVLANSFRRIGRRLLGDGCGGLSARLNLAAEEAEMGAEVFPLLVLLADDLRNLDISLTQEEPPPQFFGFQAAMNMPDPRLVKGVLHGNNWERWQTLTAAAARVSTLAMQLRDGTRRKIQGPEEVYRLSLFEGVSEEAARDLAYNTVQSGCLIDATITQIGKEMTTTAAFLETLAPLIGLFAFSICPASDCTEAGASNCEALSVNIIPATKFGLKPYTIVERELAFAKTMADAIDGTIDFLGDLLGEFTPDDIKDFIKVFGGSGGLVFILKEAFKKAPAASKALLDLVSKASKTALANPATIKIAGVAAGIIGPLIPGLFAFYVILNLLQILQKRLVGQGFFLCVEVKYQECCLGICYNTLEDRQAVVRITPLDLKFGPGNPLFSNQSDFALFQSYRLNFLALNTGKAQLQALEAGLAQVKNKTDASSIQARKILTQEIERIKKEIAKLEKAVKAGQVAHDKFEKLALTAACNKVVVRKGKLNPTDLC